MRIRLDDSSFVSDLTEFLRRCECRVDRVGPRILRVELDHDVGEAVVLQRTRKGYCATCGEPIERVLVNLGSTKCHDCRDGAGTRDWARMEIGAFLRVWTLRHPEAQAQLLG